MYEYIQAGLAGVGGLMQGYLGKAAAENSNRLSAANAENSNRVRTAGNAFAAARGALSRYMQSEGNNHRLEAGGEALEANLINARRREDVLASASFEDQIKAAEQSGSQVAAAAFVGVGGEVADMVSGSTRLMQQRAAREAQNNQAFRLYDDARRAGVIMTQTIRGLDSSLILDALDYSRDVPTHKSAANPWTQGLFAYFGAGGLSTSGDFGSKPSGASASKFSTDGWGTGDAFGNADIGMFL